MRIDTQTGATQHDYVTVSDFAVAGGKMYYREPHEVDAAIVKMLRAA